MASKYAKPLQVPAEFPDVLRAFTREVLRLQGKVETQEAIFEFGAQYFRELLEKRNGGAGSKASVGAGGVTDVPVPMYVQLSEEDVRDAISGALEAVRGQEDSGMVAFEELKQVRDR